MKKEEQTSAHKIKTINSQEWATWLCNPTEREWMKLGYLKQGYTKIVYRDEVLWRIKIYGETNE